MKFAAHRVPGALCVLVFYQSKEGEMNKMERSID